MIGRVFSAVATNGARVFWSEGEVAKTAAATFAKANGGNSRPTGYIIN